MKDDAMTVGRESPLQQLKGYLTQHKSRLQEGVKPGSAERAIKMALMYAAVTPDVARCDHSTVFRSLAQALNLGLELGAGQGEAYLVPYKGECTLQVGYRGMIKLVKADPDVVDIDADIIYENDEYRIERGTNPSLMHVPCISSDPGKPLLAYAVVTYRNGHTRFARCTAEEIEMARAGSNSPAWKKWWGEMAKKTAIKRLCKSLPMSGTADEVMFAEDRHPRVEHVDQTTGEVTQVQHARRKELAELTQSLSASNSA